VLDNVLREELQALFGPDDGPELRPFRLEFLFAFDLLALSDLLEVRVDLRSLRLVEC